MAYVVWGGVTYAIDTAYAVLLFLGAVTLAWLISYGIATEVPNPCDQPNCVYDYE